MNDILPGFASALDAQACFRALLTAFSTPGSAVSLPVSIAPPAGLSPACAAVLLTLADPQTKLALPPASAARDWLIFHTGAVMAGPHQADFCVAPQWPDLAGLRQGRDDAPEEGATLILDLPSLEEGAKRVRLSGPGLEGPVTEFLPLDAKFLADWRAQERIAPRGVDVLICAGTTIVALPRSLHIEEG
jgi:alpha-D-ribose 1-methylphosphonate 5-triphosphate synthase subunit PhnH